MQRHGGFSAAMEIDEEFTKCGRYSYCWPRDAVYVTKALDILKMEKDTEKFYKVFCKMTQSKNRNVGTKIFYRWYTCTMLGLPSRRNCKCCLSEYMTIIQGQKKRNS